ncbi:Rne/Rng family ribonuclease [Candidatus Oleimmundimicrobium sp.]|uniref:Rne/Rng family ribonuclease n=1 Tax=Candidatus Oleimmundimicrobium sp. TaxID=3060597 RepID=UPI002727319C|nr:Rne/Rng family ribonuclease [Candidatus Oleimmundimicrobium sp.]MDO8886145.1 Rne/Rng family ribonuclease [Candidatus Oleimmundimicrobium sp.]
MDAEIKEMMISADEDEVRVAIVEDSKLAEIYIERIDTHSIVGNVYLGKVKDVLPGMEASFIDIGLRKNAFLYVDEVLFSEEEMESTTPLKIQHMLKKGQDVLIQVTREPMGTKGARVTTFISLAGKYLVLMPYGDVLGVSKRLPEEEKKKLKEFGKKIKPKNMGLIIRTAAEGAKLDDLKKDLNYLKRAWNMIKTKADRSKSPNLIYSEEELALKMVRDVFASDFQRLIIDCPQRYKKIMSYLKKTNPEFRSKVQLYKDSMPLFDKFNINSQIESSLNRKVWLRSGGHISIDPTEALTAIDVNTGKYVGKTSLGETIFKTNLEAADEVARQIRLRDIGGIVVIDFIDMIDPRHRKKLFQAFNNALACDRTKSKVVEISKLGLAEMTRKNVSEGIMDILYETCSCCKGTGKIPSKETIFINLKRKLYAFCVSNPERAFLFKIHPDVADFVIGKNQEKLQKLQKRARKIVYIVEDSSVPSGDFELVVKGSRTDVRKIYINLMKTID